MTQSLQQSAADSRIILVAGRRGMGKSHLQWALCDELLESGAFANLVIFDPVVCAPEYAEYADQLKMRLVYSEFDAKKRRATPAIPVGPEGHASGQKQDWRHTLYVLDEVDKLCTSSTIDDNLFELLNYSRHWADSLICSFRRLARVNRDLDGLASDLYVFRTVTPRDLDALEALVDGLEGREGRTLEGGGYTIDGELEQFDRGRVKLLETFHFYHFEL